MEYYKVGKVAKIVENIITIVEIIAALIFTVAMVFGVIYGKDTMEWLSDIALIMFTATQFALGIFKRYKASRFTTKSNNNNEISICYQDIAEADISGVTPSKQQRLKEYIKQCWVITEEKELWRLRYERYKKQELRAEAYATIVLAVLLTIAIVL